ncbi:MAG: mqnD [Sphingobacteriales bacterium]|nr:mqnD [Sphingobacteriales bacterium]
MLTLGFSPCPNDTFIFDALIHHKIDTEGLQFEVLFEDVETLNQKALRGELDITKLSYHAYAYVIENYVLLDAGSALGFGVGPLLVSGRKYHVSSNEEVEGLKLKVEGQSSNAPTTKSKEVESLKLKVESEVSSAPTTHNSQPTTYSHELSAISYQPLSNLNDPQHTTDNSQHKIPISQLKIGIPGKYTTANFLLSLAFPDAKNKVEMVFSDIEKSLLEGSIDLGLIIHENRFTYQDKGLHKIIDLGEFWEKLTGCAIPLGGIMIKRSLPDEIKHKVNRIIRRSVEFAFENPKSGIDFISAHSQEMSEEVMYKHIELYVNKYSIDLGTEGRKAVTTLFDEAIKRKVIPEPKQNLFL